MPSTDYYSVRRDEEPVVRVEELSRDDWADMLDGWASIRCGECGQWSGQHSPEFEKQYNRWFVRHAPCTACGELFSVALTGWQPVVHSYAIGTDLPTPYAASDDGH